MSVEQEDWFTDATAREILVRLTPAELAAFEQEAFVKGCRKEDLVLAALRHFAEKADRDQENFPGGIGRSGDGAKQI